MTVWVNNKMPETKQPAFLLNTYCLAHNDREVDAVNKAIKATVAIMQQLKLTYSESNTFLRLVKQAVEERSI